MAAHDEAPHRRIFDQVGDRQLEGHVLAAGATQTGLDDHGVGRRCSGRKRNRPGERTGEGVPVVGMGQQDQRGAGHQLRVLAQASGECGRRRPHDALGVDQHGERRAVLDE
ncbi:MAG: hypothetical protein NVSMB16_08730 [Acidimicrobiales bacterium]